MVDFKPNLPELFSISEVESVCRICLCPKNILYSIFENKIDILISAFTLYKPYRNDGYPHQICPICYKEIKSAYCFMKQCQSAHNFVKLFLNKPLSKKTIDCNLCTSNFCSNSNLKRHLKNVHYLEWEIGTPRPDESNNFKNPINIRKYSNLRSECDSYVESFESDLNYKENVCATNYEENLLFMNPTDKRKRKLNFEDSSQNKYVKRLKNDIEFLSNTATSNILENGNFGNLNDLHSTHDISPNKNNYLIPVLKTPTFKDLIISSAKDEKTKMLSYFNLMPKDKFEEYDNLIKLKKDERRRAYKILKEFSINKSKSLLKTKNFGRIEDDKFECSECKKQFENINSKKRHELSHSKDPKRFACAICLREFSEIDHLRFHVKNDHQNSIIKSPYQCVICKALHIQIVDLLNHFQFCGVEKTICTDNAFLTSLHKEEKQENKRKDFSISPIHIINQEECSNQSYINIINPNDESASNSDQCEIFFDPMNYCDANFSDDIKYEQATNSFYKSNSKGENSDLLHFEKNNIDFLKSLLDVEGALDSELILKKMEDNERNSYGNFECEICKKQFGRKAHLQRHYLTHTTSKLFACEFCYTKFSCPEYVLTHMNRVHIDKVSQIVDDHAKMQNYKLVKINNDKVNEFSKSNFQFIVRIKPTINVPKNDVLKTKDGKFECKTCHKIFSRADHVRRHELIHSKVPKRFICEFCSRVFSRADNFKKHLDFYCIYKKDLSMSSNVKS